MLVFVPSEDVARAMSHVTRRGDIGEQYEAARLFFPTDDTLCLRANSRTQSIVHGFDRPWLVTAWPTPAIQGPFLHGDVHLMVGGVHGAKLGRRRFRIGAAEIFLLLSGPDGALHSTIRGLDVPLEPLLPPFVLRARMDDHRPIGGPVERDRTLIGFIGRPGPVLGRLRMGEGPEIV